MQLMKKTTNSTGGFEISRLPLEQQVEKQLPHMDQSRLITERLAAIGRVSAAIVQEFNNPLQAITNILAGIHRRGSFDSEDMSLIDLAYHEVIKLNKQVKDLREFYQPIHGKTDLFDMQSELERIIDINRQRLTGEDINITTKYVQNSPLIHAVAEQMRMVLGSQINTVMKACLPHASIEISTSVDEGSLILQIKCSKCDIDQFDISKLFEPFSTPEMKITERELELAKCYAIITLHGGIIKTDIYGEQGTIIKLILPIKNKEDNGKD